MLAAGRAEAAAAAPQTASHSEAAPKPAPLIRIGILLGTFAGPTLEARLDAVKACGLDCVQVSLDCAGLPAMPEEISPGWPTGFAVRRRGVGSRLPPCRAPST